MRPPNIFRGRKAFTLVEVVLALAVVTFCIFAILALLTVGAQASHDSSELLQATTIASQLISERRAAPTNAINTPSPFPVWPFTNAVGTTVTNDVYVSADGCQLASAQTNLPTYRLLYTVTINTNNSASLYCSLSWPSSIDPKVNPAEVKGRYEVFTCIPLP
jgi:Tfp pilus assembly protein PilV